MNGFFAALLTRLTEVVRGPVKTPRVHRAVDLPEPRRALFICGALVVSVLGSGALGGLYLVGARYDRLPVPRLVYRVPFIRTYLGDTPLGRLLQFVDAEASDQLKDVFPTVWDTTASVLLSKKMYRAVDMGGAQKYMYRPGLKKLGLWATSAEPLSFDLEVEDTPRARELVKSFNILTVSSSYNEFGFRHVDAELTSNCEVRALFLGDSFTDGMWVNDADTFVNHYGHLVRERSGVRVCPMNAGVNGYGSMEEAYVLEHYFDAIGRPRLVFVMHFANDVDQDYFAVLGGTLTDGARKWDQSLLYVRRMLHFARAHDTTAIVVAIPAKLQLSQPETRRHYQDVLRQFCAREGAPFIDLLDGLQRFDPEDLYWERDPHFRPRGHRAVAEILFQDTRDLLKPVNGR